VVTYRGKREKKGRSSFKQPGKRKTTGIIRGPTKRQAQSLMHKISKGREGIWEDENESID